MDIEKLYKIFCKVPVISTDTRKPVRNTIFFALRGDRFDGNTYADEAIRNGAAYAVVDNKSVADNRRIIVVENSLSALQQLAALHRKKIKTIIIAITGSNGKTTTKDLISGILSKKNTVCSTRGNLNNHIGVPLTILSIKPEDRFGVVEIGANHPGEIADLCRIARPGYGLITNIGRAHLEGFGSVDGVMRAKGELYEYLQDSGGKVFVNCGDQMLMDMLMNFPGEVIRYGNGEGTICSGGIDKTDPFLHIHVNPGNMPGNRINIRTRMLGDFNLENILAAVGVGYYFDVNVERIMEAVSEYIPDMLRSQILKSRHNTLFVDAYNANPTSMLAAIRNFQKNAGENKMLILGEMAELGEVSEAEHIALVSHIVESGIKRVILIGKSFLKLSVPEEFIRFNDVQAMVEWLHAHPIRNADILLKGSRIVGLEKLIQYL